MKAVTIGKQLGKHLFNGKRGGVDCVGVEVDRNWSRYWPGGAPIKFDAKQSLEPRTAGFMVGTSTTHGSCQKVKGADQ